MSLFSMKWANTLERCSWNQTSNNCTTTVAPLLLRSQFRKAKVHSSQDTGGSKLKLLGTHLQLRYSSATVHELQRYCTHSNHAGLE
eukprot:4292953-Amphidinium_carterae.1